MKILILYTGRSGTNNICNYFLKQKPNYKYFNQPFTNYKENGITNSSYNECIKYNDVLVKSEIANFVRLNIGVEQLLLDFDKVILISRKNKREQAISYAVASMNKDFLSNKQKNYYIGGLDDTIIDNTLKFIIYTHNQLMEFMNESFPFYYYEDLFYGDFSELFKYLGIQYIQDDFDNILNIKHRYRSNDLFIKNNKTLI